MGLVDRLEWHDDHFTVNGVRFRSQFELGVNTLDDAFVLYKHRRMLDEYDRFFGETGFRPSHVLELGIWDGGSAAFWTETLDLARYAAIDLQTRGDSAYFDEWSRTRGAGRAATYWGVSQTDASGLARVIAEAQLDPLDLVIDDCSHQRTETARSFELLFPRVRPGGYYVIEDWAWALQPEYQDRAHPWSVLRSMHPVIHRLVDVHGARPDVIASLRVASSFVALERGDAALTSLEIDALVPKRQRPWVRIAIRNTRGWLGRLRS